jgi:hypothetical protein
MMHIETDQLFREREALRSALDRLDEAYKAVESINYHFFDLDIITKLDDIVLRIEKLRKRLRRDLASVEQEIMLREAKPCSGTE